MAPATGIASGCVATAGAGSKFVRWADENGKTVSFDAAFTPDKPGGAYDEATYYAYFTDSGKIQINYRANTGGTVSNSIDLIDLSSGQGPTGSEAHANEGYHFVNWTDQSGNFAGDDATLIPQPVGGSYLPNTYYANFEADSQVTINYKIKTDGADDTKGGSVTLSSEQVAPAGTARGSEAKANAGYDFVNWTDESGEEVSIYTKLNPPKDGVYQNATYYANFKTATYDEVEIYYVVSPSGAGSLTCDHETVTKASPQAKGSIASENSGFKFEGWYTKASGGELVEDNNQFVPEVTFGDYTNITFFARFSVVPEETVNITYTAMEGGTCTPDHETINLATGEPVGSTATPNKGYIFVGWKDMNGKTVCPDVYFKPEKPSEDVEYYAYFVKNTEKLLVKYIALAGGKVSLDYEEVDKATGITLSGSVAQENVGYGFVGWTSEDKSTVVSQNKNFVPSSEPSIGLITEDRTFYAKFAENAAVTYTYIADEGGLVDGNKKVSETVLPASGEPAGSLAEPNEGYEFVNWTDTKGSVVGTEAHYLPVRVGGLYAGGTFTAHFKKTESKQATIKYLADNGGQTSPDTETLDAVTGIAKGSTASAGDGYVFVNWTDEKGNVVGKEAHFTPEKVDKSAETNDIDYYNDENTDSAEYVSATYTAHFAAKTPDPTPDPDPTPTPIPSPDPSPSGGGGGASSGGASYTSPAGELYNSLKTGDPLAIGFVGFGSIAIIGLIILLAKRRKNEE